ncbi:MAG: hypothetical protein JWO37_2667 [Acidimicrobiales bacterium]|jgi:uncharacterized protein YndB with AHSA1/START domain|nr:hypothetical protein [Acidimicrobiales bacterium]
MNQDLGELEKLADDRWQVRYTRTLGHPPEKVWHALTEPEHLDAWFPTTIDGERKAGAPLSFHFREHEADDFDGRMLTYEPPKVLELMWGEDRLRFELHPAGDATELVLLVTTAERGKLARDGAGWHQKLDELRSHLDGEAVAADAASTWKSLFERYQERFGREASAIGPPEGMGDDSAT